MVPSNPPTTIRSPVTGLNATLITGVDPTRGLPTGWRFVTSNNRTVKSSPPATSKSAAWAERHAADQRPVREWRYVHPFGGRYRIPDTHCPVRAARCDEPAVAAECNAIDRSAVLHCRRELLAAIARPHLEYAVVISGGDPVTARAERHTPHRSLTAHVDGVQECTAVGIPYPHLVVVAARCYPASVLAHRDTLDRYYVVLPMAAAGFP